MQAMATPNAVTYLNLSFEYTIRAGVRVDGAVSPETAPATKWPPSGANNSKTSLPNEEQRARAGEYD